MKLSSFSIALSLVGCNGIKGIEIGRPPVNEYQVLPVSLLESHIVLSAKIDLQKIRKPIQLFSAPDVWLQISPKEISCSKIDTQDDILRASFSIVANMQALFGKKPKPLPPSSSTASVDVQVAEGKKSVLRLPIILGYASIKEKLKKVFKRGQKWEPLEGEPTYRWTVTDVDVYPSGENLVVGVFFIADSPIVEGPVKVYMRGKPVIDNMQRIVRIKNPDFTITKKGISIWKGLWWKWKGLWWKSKIEEIKEKVVSKLSYSFGDRVDKLVDDVNGKLKKDLGNGVKNQGTLNYKKVDQLLMLREGIYLSTILEGKFEITFRM